MAQGMIRFGKGLDLSRNLVEALVEMTQVATQLRDNLDHARREKLRMPAQNVRQGRAQETNARTTGGGMRSAPIRKFCSDLWVCAPQ